MRYLLSILVVLAFFSPSRSFAAAPIGVANVSYSSTSPTSEDLTGTVASWGFSDSIRRGFRYGISGAAAVQEYSDEPFSAGNFTLNLPDLTCETEYEVSTFAENADGFTNSGDTMTFTTGSCDVVEATSTSLVYGNSSIIHLETIQSVFLVLLLSLSLYFIITVIRLFLYK